MVVLMGETVGTTTLVIKVSHAATVAMAGQCILVLLTEEMEEMEIALTMSAAPMAALEA
jgi:hypothetical protein